MIEYQINPQTRYLNSSFQFPEKNRFSLLGLYRPYSLPRVFWKPGKLQRYKIEEQAFVGRDATIPEKYKENFDVSSEGPSSNSRRRAFARNIESFLIFLR
jgi:hypothetical protein